MSQESTPDAEDADSTLSPEERRGAIRDRYGGIAATESGAASQTDDASAADDGGCCGGEDTAETSCCGDDSDLAHAQTLGYDPVSLEQAPEESNLGLGCGNPTALARLEPGATVLDLGAGAGFDCFLAAREVGDEGQVIGVDMTPEMVERARSAADRNGIENVQFRLGEIEHLPVSDGTVDTIISNCVINLSPRKARVFEEAYRVLRPGGRLAISDIVVSPEGEAALDRSDPEQIAQCIAGAETMETLRDIVEAAGFQDVTVEPKDDSDEIIESMYGDGDLRDLLYSAVISGVKPPG